MGAKTLDPDTASCGSHTVAQRTGDRPSYSAFKTFCGLLLYHRAHRRRRRRRQAAARLTRAARGFSSVRAAAAPAIGALNLDPIEIRITSQYCTGL
jgi:hypothetical protein